jgi:prepilin-type N-terminal cleavage/methylation domain-containing protein
MNFPTRHSFRRVAKGFTLVEMLTTIAILAVLTSIALPSMSSINQNSVDTRDRRNAQELSAICAVAQAAGLDFVAGEDLAQTVRNVVEGGAPTDGAFAGKFFGMKGMAPTDQASALRYLEILNGTLSYKPQL